MKIAGHTMGTPEYTLPEAIRLFSRMGLDGIEIIVQTDGYRCAIGLNDDPAEIDAIRGLAMDAGLEIACLTPYMNRYNSLNEAERAEDCSALKKVIMMARRIGAPSIRVYGGKLVTGEVDSDGAKLERLVASMRECGDFAAEHSVRLCLENHFGTMTTTATRTAEIIRAIDHPNVGILYDQANIAFFPAEEYQEALDRMAGMIFHVHVKDLIYREGAGTLTCTEVAKISESERTVHSRIPGEGILDWRAILKGLADIGYAGWLSLEYERRWQTIDLPEASVGMAKALRHVRSCLPGTS